MTVKQIQCLLAFLSYYNGAIDGIYGDTTLYAQWIENASNTAEPTSGTFIVWCKAGETIVIPNLPAGTTYTVTEISGTHTDDQGNEIRSGKVTANTFHGRYYHEERTAAAHL